MAIDTDGEKASLINMGTPFPIMGPLLDGAFGIGEQLHLLNLYSGILPAGGPPTIPTPPGRTLRADIQPGSVIIPKGRRTIGSGKRNDIA